MSINRLSKEEKMTIQLFLGVFVVLSGLVLLFMGLWMPPLGIIDSSVLVAFGEAATFAGALIGIDYSYKYKVIKLDKDTDFRQNPEE